MRKIILLLSLSIMFLISCEPTIYKEKPGYVEGYKVITIDSCEYIEVDEGFIDNRYYSLTHKGNCKNHKK